MSCRLIKHFATLVFVLVGLSSCRDAQQEQRTSSLSSDAGLVSSSLNNTKVPTRLLSLHDEAEVGSTAADIQENLFGKFYADRAAYYIVRNPTNRLFHTKIKQMTMYYLDGRMSKTRYIMEENIANRLIKSFGSFKISGYDDKNRALIRENKFFTAEQESLSLNEDFDNYALHWTFGHMQLSYRVDLSNKDETYSYTESLQNFDKKFKTIKIEED